MKNKTIITDYNPGRLNSFILKLNRSTYILIIAIYSALLLLVLFFANPTGKVKSIIPNYEHNPFAPDVHTQIELLPNYSYSTSREELDVYYYLYAKNKGKLDETKKDPGYTIDHFLFGTRLSNDKMYYFNEMFGYSTEITHTYYLNEYDSSVPKEFYITNYYTDLLGNKQKNTYKEEILEFKDQARFNHVNTISHFEGETIVTDVRLRFGATKTSTSYRISTRLTLGDYDKTYHIDMQSWIVTAKGDVYPFIGLYSYQNETGMYTYNNLSFPLVMDAKYLYAKLHYYLPDEEVKTIQYRVLIEDLPTSISQDPVYSDTIEDIKEIPWATISIISASALLGIGLAGIVYNYQKKKKEKLG